MPEKSPRRQSARIRAKNAQDAHSKDEVRERRLQRFDENAPKKRRKRRIKSRPTTSQTTTTTTSTVSTDSKEEEEATTTIDDDQSEGNVESISTTSQTNRHSAEPAPHTAINNNAVLDLEPEDSDGSDVSHCGICQDPFCDEEPGFKLCTCRHKFHGECLSIWADKRGSKNSSALTTDALLAARSCPLCRGVITVRDKVMARALSQYTANPKRGGSSKDEVLVTVKWDADTIESPGENAVCDFDHDVLFEQHSNCTPEIGNEQT